MDIAKLRKKAKKAKKKAEKAPSVDKKQGEAKRPTVRDDIAATGETPLAEESSVPVDEVGKQAGESELSASGATDMLVEEGHEHETAGDIVEFLTFRLGKEYFAIRVLDVEELLRPQKITSVPKTTPFVTGITSFRGKIIPLVDIRGRLSAGVDDTEEGRKPKIIILRGPRGSIGIQIQSGLEVIMVSEADILEPPSHLTEEESRYVEGVFPWDGGYVSIVRLDELLHFDVILEA
jgi:purine-binding chemotaxis protein CheW